MKIIVLLSHGLHPVTARPCPVPVETQAIALALTIPGSPSILGLHAGPPQPALREYGGHGLQDILHLSLPPGANPFSPLCETLAAHKPELILAGYRAQGGDDSGLLPYSLAAALGLQLCAGAVAIAQDAHGMSAIQALPKGQRRRVAFPLPAIVTVHPLAPPPLPFAFARARQTRITENPLPAPPPPGPPLEELPYRPRPKFLAPASASTAGARLLVHPSPDEAAAAILDALAAIGVLPGA